jgi:hypothetical protein
MDRKVTGKVIIAAEMVSGAEVPTNLLRLKKNVGFQ